MTYSTKKDLIDRLQTQFNKTVDSTQVKVKLSRNTPTSIYVNDQCIEQINGSWYVGTEQFHYKKSAVGYCISIVNNDRETANSIKFYDHRVNKLTEDVKYYIHSMRKTRSKVRKNILSCRLSDSGWELEGAREHLQSNLVSINLA